MTSATHSNWLKITTLTTLSLIAFASNSIIGRLALGTESIDAAGFTMIRLGSGALTLGLVIMLKGASPLKGQAKHWLGALMLFAYAICFSYAYLTLETGTGALILFGAVQVSMVLYAFFTGSRLILMEWLGLLLAFGGFVYLVLPGVEAPSLSGFILMTLSGIAWAGYTLIGRGAKEPVFDSGRIFVRVLPLLLVVLGITFRNLDFTSTGVWLALLSGVVSSAFGYILWYQTLAYLSAVQAGVLQLLVPPIASVGGILFMSEPITLRLLVASLLILGGIFLVIFAKLKKS